MAEGGFDSKKVLRLVLLGWASSGKSASGNTILGRDEFLQGRRSSKCLSGRAQVVGREVTVVDTPGWVDYSVQDTPESTQQEIISSTIPAPDAVLLLIPLHMEITEEYISSVFDHLSLLGDAVWRRTMVLFTFGNCLQNQTAECHIEANQALQSLMRLCSNNYHVFNNAKRKDGVQVENLLKKIENMLMESSIIQDPEEVHYVSEEKEEMLMENTAAQNSEVDCEKPKACGGRSFSELRMVLLGCHKTGKSSTGNTILGSDKFGEWTAKYHREEAEVAGRTVVVIDTPGWQKNATEISPEQNIVNSICQCPPGPHALLLVVNLSSNFTSEQWSYIQRYMGLLGERAWEHVIVIFTGADIFQDIAIRPFMRHKDVSFQKLLEKCGNRYYLFNNRNRDRSTQVRDLLEGIEKLSSQHSPGFYEIDKAVVASMEEMNKDLHEKAQKRYQKVTAKDHALSAIFREGKAHRLSNVRLVLLGAKRSGKTTAAKTMAKLQFSEEKTKCVATKTIIDERILLVVDTPGWSNDSWFPQKPEMITEALSLCHPGPHAFLIVVNLRHNFTEKHRVAMEQHLACLSDTMWRNTMVLFTSGEELRGETVETHIEREGEALQWLVEKCENRYHVFSDTPFNDLPQVKELLEGIDKMVEANSGRYFSNIISKIHREKDFSEEWSDPMHREDDDFEYTPRERRIIKEIRELLLVDIKRYLSTARSLDLTNPSMSLDKPTPSEDELIGRGRGNLLQDSGYITPDWMDRDADNIRMTDSECG